MYRMIVAAVVLLSLPIQVFGGASTDSDPGIELSLDLKSAKAVLDAFEREGTTGDELEEMIRLPGVRALIHQASRFDSRASEGAFKTSLHRAIAGEPLEEDPFQFRKVKDRLSEIATLVQKIESSPDRLVSDIREMIRPYAPGDLSFEVNVCFVVGGSSDGWTREDVFYVALHYFRDDHEGLKLLMAHELYHVAQGHFYGYAVPSEDSAIAACRSVLGTTRSEGMASVVGDPLALVEGGAYTDWFKGKFSRNLRRIEQNFALFELMLFRLYHDPESDFSQLYPLGFSGGWDSPLYFVGYYVGKAIERHRGREALVELLRGAPAAYFQAYVEIYEQDEDEELVRFSDAVERILQAL